MDDAIAVPLTQGLVAWVDVADYPTVATRRWIVHLTGSAGLDYAVSAHLDGQPRVRMHRLILGLRPGDPHVDHRDLDGLNNRRSNLRLATIAENGRNRRMQRNNQAGYKGVSADLRNGRWLAVIMADGKRYNLGTWGTPERAARAYDAAARELHDEFARLNFPT